MSSAEPAAQLSGDGQAPPQQAAVLVLGKAAATLADVIAPILLVRAMTKTDYGILGELLLIFTAAATISASGFPRALLYFMPGRTRGERYAIVVRAAKILLGFAAIVALGFVLYEQVLVDLLAPDPQLTLEAGDGLAPGPSGHFYLTLVALYLVLDLPTRLLINLLIVERRARAAAGTALIKAIGVSIATIVPAALGADIATIVVAIVIFAALYLAFSIVIVVRLYADCQPAPLADDLSVRRLIGFSLPLGMTDIVNMVGQGLDRFLIMAFFAEAAFADYQNGAWKIPVVSGIAYAVGNVYLPRFKELYAAGRPEEAVAIWRATSLKVALIVAPFAVAFFVAAEDLVVLLFTEDYLDTVPIFRWYTVLTLGRVAQFGGPLLAANRPRTILVASAFALGSNVAISVPLVLLVGFEGPAIGTVIAFVPTVMFYCYFIAKSSNVAFTATFPLVGYLRIVSLAAIAGVAGWLVDSALEAPPAIELTAVIVTVCVTFGIIGTLTRQITAADWKFARDFLRLRVLRK